MAFHSEASQNLSLLFLIVCFEIVLVEGQCTAKDCTNDVSVETAQGIVTEILMNQLDALQQNLQNIQKSLADHNSHMEILHENTTNQIQDFGRRLQEVDQYSRDQNKLSDQLMKEVRDLVSKPRRDCSDIRATGWSQSGVYTVYLTPTVATSVYCDMQSDGSSWLVFQRRINGSVDFYRNWTEYANGFGDPSGEFWVGNDNLHLLTSRRNYKMRVELEMFNGTRGFAEYSRFSISSSTDKYRLNVSGYSGNAGDRLAFHNGQQFTTKDANNDANGGNCAVFYSGAWWYNDCYDSNLNGLYLSSSSYQQLKGINWDHSGYKSLKATQIQIALV